MTTVWANLLGLVETLLVSEEPALQALVLSWLNNVIAKMTGQAIPAPITPDLIVKK